MGTRIAGLPRLSLSSVLLGLIALLGLVGLFVFLAIDGGPSSGRQLSTLPDRGVIALRSAPAVPVDGRTSPGPVQVDREPDAPAQTRPIPDAADRPPTTLNIVIVTVRPDGAEAPAANVQIQIDLIEPRRRSVAAGRTDAQGRFSRAIAMAPSNGTRIGIRAYSSRMAEVAEEFEVIREQANEIIVRATINNLLVGTIRTDNGELVDRVRLAIRPHESANNHLRNARPPVQNGIFEVSNMVEGRYALSVSDPNYLVHQQLFDFVAPMTEIDITLRTGALVTLTVVVPGGEVPTRTIIQLERSPGEAPVVEADPLDEAFNRSIIRNFPSAAVSAENPTVTIAGIYPGNYLIHVRSPELQPFEQELVVPALDSVIEQQVIVATGAVITGTVTSGEGEGEPVANARIQITMTDAEHVPIRSGRTDEDGTYRVPGLLPGPATLVVSSVDHLEHEQPVEITEEPAIVDVTLDPGATLSGSVETPNGEPVTQGAIRLINLEGAITQGAMRHAQIDETGYHAGGLAPGQYRVEVYGTEFLTPADLVVAIVSAGTTLDIILERGLVLSGTVQDVDGEPVANARIMLIPANGGEISTGNGLTLGIGPSASSREDGTYEIIGIAPGGYDVTVRAQGFALTSVAMTISADTSRMLQVDRGNVLTGLVTVSGGAEGPVDGYVTLEPTSTQLRSTGDALNKAAFGSQSAMIERTGAFRIEGIADGAFTLRVHMRSPGAQGQRQMVQARQLTITSDQDISVTVEIPAVFRVGGRVVDSNGDAVRDATLTLRPSDGRDSRFDIRRGRTGHDGTFVVTDVPEGRYEVVGSSRDGRAITPSWTLNVRGGNLEGQQLRTTGTLSGARLVGVGAGSVAARAGLRALDIITHLGGVEISSRAELEPLILRLAENSTGGQIEVRYVRDGSPAATYVARGLWDIDLQ